MNTKNYNKNKKIEKKTLSFFNFGLTIFILLFWYKLYENNNLNHISFILSKNNCFTIFRIIYFENTNLWKILYFQNLILSSEIFHQESLGNKIKFRMDENFIAISHSFCIKLSKWFKIVLSSYFTPKKETDCNKW